MLEAVRQFFKERHVVEVDCPFLTASAAVDAHIDLITACVNDQEQRYLHSSPEYGMKRLLAAGSEDIYQLSHVFRNNERGTRHTPEFMMAEWYRKSISFGEMIAETCDFIRLFVGDVPYHILSYQQAFQHYTHLDISKTSNEELLALLSSYDIVTHLTSKASDRDALLNTILGCLIEPRLGQQGLCVLTYYPASQATLAKTTILNGEEVAERFEVYYQGMELANGYHELSDSQEQRHRFLKANHQRIMMGKEKLPIDEKFLEALDHLPDCCGVAVGFDRLMMLRHDVRNIDQVIPFSWEEI